MISYDVGQDYIIARSMNFMWIEMKSNYTSFSPFEATNSFPFIVTVAKNGVEFYDFLHKFHMAWETT